MAVGDEFALGPSSKETLVTHTLAPEFHLSAIRMAGVTTVCDYYLCTRVNPQHHTLVLTLTGCGHLQYEGECYPLVSQSLAVMKSGETFSYSASRGDWCFAWFILEAGQQWDADIAKLTAVSQTFFNHITAQMLALLAADIAPATKSSLSAEVISIVGRITQIDVAAHQVPPRLQSLFQSIERQLHSQWSVVRMAESIYCSQATLHRLCLAAYGKSPVQKLIDMRLTRARYLLTNTDWSIDSIAMQVGYKDGAALSKIFKRKSTVAPAQYRADSRSHAERAAK